MKKLLSFFAAACVAFTSCDDILQNLPNNPEYDIESGENKPDDGSDSNHDNGSDSKPGDGPDNIPDSPQEQQKDLVKISFDISNQTTGVFPGGETVITYTLENADVNTIVTASSNGVYTVRVEAMSYDHGRIFVKCPETYTDGYINIIVSDGATYSFVKVINFYEEKIIFTEGLEYYISASGGQISIPFMANFDYEFRIEGMSEDWLTITSPDTKADMIPGTLVINAKANPFEYARTGVVQITHSNSPGDIYAEIRINQASAFFSIEQSKYAVLADGETIVTNISSSRGVTTKVPSDAAGWISTKVTNNKDDNYSITAVIKRNESLSVRSATIELYSGDGSEFVGTIEYVQASKAEDDLTPMVFVVRANLANDYTANIILSGFDYDFYIDWGDGQAQHCQDPYGYSTTYSHAYDTTVPTNYTVKIHGTLPCLKVMNCVVEVTQWGLTKVKNIDFSYNQQLTTIPGDQYGSFSELNSMSFQGCTQLKEIPKDLFTYCKSLWGISFTFEGCTSLTEIPEQLFKGCINANSFQQTFSNCTSLVKIPGNMFEGCTNTQEFINTFDNCTALTEIPEELFSYSPDAKRFDGVFNGCSALVEIPALLFSNCPDATSFHATFQGCSSLTEIPVSLFDNNKKVTSFAWAFSSCYNITGESPYTIINGIKYHLYERHLNLDYFITPTNYYGCFQSCALMSDYQMINYYLW